jgi:hypothetical protein
MFYLLIKQAIPLPVSQDNLVYYYLYKLKDQTITNRISAVIREAIHVYCKKTKNINKLNIILTQIG